jgi:mono/diheme cytochrome c family protein
MQLQMVKARTGAGSKSRMLRLFALAFAFLQIGLQASFAIGDGYEQIASSHVAPVHAEVPGNTHHRLHDADCVICHVLATSADVPQRATPSWYGEADVVAIPSALLDARLCPIADGARLPRAPPLTV